MNSSSSTEIAIIGMAGRFPASENVAQFWEHLVQGRSGVKDIKARAGSRLHREPNFVAKAATVEQADCFDASFFGILPKLASEMDPQHRLFLETAWTALEDAGYCPVATPGRVGVFAGCHMNTYIFMRLAADATFREALADSFPGGNLNAEILNDKDYLASRVAFHLNLRGPAVTVQSACSTSLVAIVQACESLAAGTSDMALAGGACITFPQDQGYLHTEDSILSPDGSCRTFDADARGTIFADGVGCVVLKRLSQAISDRDPIYAVIKGWCVNNDGGDKGSYTAPSISGQSAAIVQAHLSAGVSADTINYVEAHGTGTLVGDPIEVAALTTAFRRTTGKKQFCAIGSLKSNFGHLDVAAGVAAVIKVAMAVQHRLIPPNLHFRRANPKIDFENSPFYVQTALTPWPENLVNGQLLPRRAGVSSFGVGGTNAHLVMEEYIAAEQTDDSSTKPDNGLKLICLSAKTESALERMRGELAVHVENNASSLADIALTLRATRKPMPYRYAIAVRERDDLVAQLRSPLSKPHHVTHPKLAMVFPGQGSQHAGMAQRLYQQEPQFANYVDQAALALLPHVGIDLRTLLAPASSLASQIDQTAYAQPAIFMLSYALAQWLLQRGIKPDYVVGHSVGEFAAATVAGVMSLEDGARLVAARGRLMQALPPGSMMAVNLSSARLQQILPPQIELAAFNAPEFNVLAGPTDQLAMLQKQLESGHIGEEVNCRLLRTSHAFHSATMAEAIEPFARIIEQCKLSVPSIPMISTVTGKLLSNVEATSLEYWSNQIRWPVQFSVAIQTLMTNPQLLMCEVGPNQVLTTLIRQHSLNSPSQTVIPLLPQARQAVCDHQHALSAIGQMWSLGIESDATEFCPDPNNIRRIHLPGYSFERQRHWFDIANPIPHLSSNYDEDSRPENVTPTAHNLLSEQTTQMRDGHNTLASVDGSTHPAIELIKQQLEMMHRQLYLLTSLRNRS